MAQSLWQTVSHFLKSFNMDLPNNLAILPQEKRKHLHT